MVEIQKHIKYLILGKDKENSKFKTEKITKGH